MKTKTKNVFERIMVVICTCGLFLAVIFGLTSEIYPKENFIRNDIPKDKEIISYNVVSEGKIIKLTDDERVIVVKSRLGYFLLDKDNYHEIENKNVYFMKPYTISSTRVSFGDLAIISFILFLSIIPIALIWEGIVN